ncbi:4'-phosphopantetheinyl transferase [Nicoletella semolina]|uniref:4'-phosphopantetheinyl transferase n=1 Tax=Nicoletella semolina TaxID=271160 RepID=A0A4R2N7W1_9PAST|nr:4'-phosphopantetheinyl transferase superfamily protein [Nicoletella semolina]MDH2924674.1 4'-phosphopantetheinyl transferase [Nicoletella semolina]TCP17040.1 4'-phosphopantetheinyl transferase [Nicoletella semolina]
MPNIAAITPTIEVIFAHHNEPIPAEFLDFRQSNLMPMSARQLAKWKSRRMAYFLLDQLCQKYQIETSLLDQINKTHSGRPYLSHPNIDFNISHSGEWVAIIFNISQPKRYVGIDIEHPQKTRPYLKLLDYYADTTEIQQIQDCKILADLDRLEDRFYLSWCLREAVLKSQGVGIVKLSEVKHRLDQQTIHSNYCPKGILHFYSSLPFYLAFFLENISQHNVAIPIWQWKNQQYHAITGLQPIVYRVN